HRLERLDAQAVQRRRTVQQHRVIADDLFQDLEHFGALALDDLLGALDRFGDPLVHELVDDERLEQLERHGLGQPALMQLELRAHHDHRAARVVHTLAEQVLPEAPLLALEHVGERLERPLATPANRLGAPAVVEQRVHRLLQHALFVAQDDLRCPVHDELLQPVVPVDHAAIEIVEVARGEAPTIERHKRTQIRRNDRNHVHDHPLGPVARAARVTRIPERVNDLEPLEHLLLAVLRRLIHHRGAQLLRHLVHVQPAQQLAHGGRPDVGPECVVVLRLRLLPQRQILILVQELVQDDILRAGVNDDVVGVIDDLLEITQGDVEHVPHGTGKRLEEPDVRHRHGELDVAHALAAHARQRDLHAAPVADYAAIADALVLAAMAFPVLDRAEDALAEEPILLRLERPVIDGLRLGDLTPGPPVALPLHFQALTLLGILGSADLLGRRDANLDEIERRAALLAHAAKINHVLLLSVAVAVHAVTVGGSELHPDAERLQLLHQYVERLRNAWLWKVLSLDDGFVYPAASVHIVRLDGENFLQRVRGAVRL